MARTILIQLFLLSLPFIIYGLCVKFGPRAEAASRGNIWGGAPWFWLFTSGLTLSIIGIVVAVTIDGAAPGAVYTPADLKGGTVMPGSLK